MAGVPRTRKKGCNSVIVTRMQTSPTPGQQLLCKWKNISHATGGADAAHQGRWRARTRGGGPGEGHALNLGADIKQPRTLMEVRGEAGGAQRLLHCI